MKNRLLPIFITSIFVIIFIFFYKGLKNTNVYTPEIKINNTIPSFTGDLFYSDEIINSSYFFKPDEFSDNGYWNNNQ